MKTYENSPLFVNAVRAASGAISLQLWVPDHITLIGSGSNFGRLGHHPWSTHRSYLDHSSKDSHSAWKQPGSMWLWEPGKCYGQLDVSASFGLILLRLCIESQHALAGSLPLSSFVRAITIVEHGTENWLTKFSRNSKNSNVYYASVQKSQVIPVSRWISSPSYKSHVRRMSLARSVRPPDICAWEALEQSIEVEITNGGYPGR